MYKVHKNIVKISISINRWVGITVWMDSKTISKQDILKFKKSVLIGQIFIDFFTFTT